MIYCVIIKIKKLVEFINEYISKLVDMVVIKDEKMDKQTTNEVTRVFDFRVVKVRMIAKKVDHCLLPKM